jgi:hypothetical protein
MRRGSTIFVRASLGLVSQTAGECEIGSERFCGEGGGRGD